MQQSQIEKLFDNDKLGLALKMYDQNSQDPKAVWSMHYYYEKGLLGVKVDLEKCMNCLKIAASQGHAGASYKLVNYISIQDGVDTIELIHKYTREEHIQKCIEKAEEYNDPPYYNQQEYIELLKNLKEQPKTKSDRNLPSNTVVRRRPTPG